MIKYVASLKYFKKNLSATNIDNLVFKLHYKFSKLILLFFGAVMYSRQLFGVSIKCFVKGVNVEVMNDHCWTHSTFTVPYTPEHKIGQNVAYQGVTNYVEGNISAKHHTYYLWVPLALILQAGLFYAPYFLWKNLERKGIGIVIDDITFSVNNDKNTGSKLSHFIEYLFNIKNKFNFYFYSFLLCEILNLCNDVLQIIFLNFFLNGAFASYGFDIIDFMNSYGEKVNPLISLFPVYTKCTFYIFGPSGGRRNVDGLCVLPLNIVNEKIYIFLWIWLYSLTIITTLWLVLEFVAIAIISNQRLRNLYLKARGGNNFSQVMYSLDGSVGEFFFFQQLASNMNSVAYNKIVEGWISRKTPIQ